MRAQSEKKSERARRNAVCRRILSFPFSSLLSLSFSLSLTHTIRRTFRRPSSFGQFHCTVGFPPSLPFFLFVFLFLSLAEFPATRNTLRPKTPRAEIRHIITSPGRYLARSLMKRKSRGSRPHLRSFVTYSPESSSRARAREHGFIVPDAPRYIAFNYLADPISHQSSSFSVARCLREERLN